jgi:hypothetical protein
MSSLVVFNQNGVTASWNKQEAYSVRSPDQPTRYYATEAKAIAAAKRKAYRRVRTLADAFVGVLRQWLTAAEFAEMKRRNVTYGQACASHDFCDANMAMWEAWLQVYGHEPTLTTDAETIEQEQRKDDEIALWNAAWSMAKKRALTA